MKKEDDKFYSIVDEMNESDCLKWVQQTFGSMCADFVVNIEIQMGFFD